MAAMMCAGTAIVLPLEGHSGGRVDDVALANDAASATGMNAASSLAELVAAEAVVLVRMV